MKRICQLILFFLLAGLYTSVVFGQNDFAKADSMWEAIPKMEDSKEKAREYSKLAILLRGVRPDSGKMAAIEMAELCGEIGFKRGQMWAFNFIIEQFVFLGMPDSARIYEEKFLLEARAYENEQAEALILSKWAIDFARAGEIDSAISLFLKIDSLKVQDSLTLYVLYKREAEIYSITGDYPTAIRNALKSLEYIAQYDGDRVGGYTKLADLYIKIGDLKNAKKVDSLQIDLLNHPAAEVLKAQICYNACARRNDWGEPEKALSWCKKGDSISNAKGLSVFRGYSAAFTGGSYFKLADYAKAESLFAIAKAAWPVDDRDLIVGESWIGLGHSKVRMGRLKEGIADCEAAYQFTSVQRSIKERMAACLCLQEGYLGLGQYEKAYQYLQDLSVLKDSSRKLDNVRQLAVAESEFEFERTEARFLADQEAAAADLKRQTLQRNGLILITVLIGVVLFLVVRSSRIQKRNNQLLEEGKIKLEKSLGEKEHLLDEIHHRVKNNLQTVSSLLSLRSRYVADTNAREALTEGQEQLKSMVFIHQQLYNNENLVAINLQVYVEQLITEMDRSHRCSEQGIQLKMDVEKIMLNVDQATPLGLILFELILNSIKHAFPEGKHGQINVQARLEARKVVVSVSDNGIGIQPEHASSDNSSYGMRLIKLMAKELNCSLDWTSDNGTEVSLSFELEELEPA